MPSVVRAPRRLLPAVLATLVVAAGVLTGFSPGEVPAALAEEDAPVKAGATLVARGDCELQKVTIARGSRVEVTSTSSSNADIALPDGHVLRKVPLSRIRYFFDVVR